MNLLTGLRLQTLCLLILLAGILSSSDVFALYFNANWDYRQSGGDQRETESQFSQRYSLGLGEAIRVKPTHAITAGAGVSYSRTQSDIDGRKTVGDQLNPNARLTLFNDIFLADLSGNASFFKSSTGRETVRSGWDSTLSSTWDIPLWPRLRLNYSEYFDTAEGSNLFDETGGKTINSSLGVNWNLILANLSYEYSRNQVIEGDDSSEVDNISHFGQVETGTSFWDNRIRTNLRHQVQESEFDISVRDPLSAADIIVSGTAWGKVVNDPLAPDPTDPVYVDPDEDDPLNPEWITLSGSDALVVDNEDVHIFFESSDLLDTIGLVHLFTNDREAESLQWDLYVRNDATSSWDLSITGLTGLYAENEDGSNRRIEILLPDIENKFLLVATNNTGLPLTFTRLSAFSLFTNDTSGTSASTLTNVGIGYRISKTVNLSANLTLNHNESDFNNVFREIDKRTISSSLRWSPTPLLTPSLNFSEYLEESPEDPDRLNRTYSLIVASRPKEEVSLSLGATRNEHNIGTLRTYMSDNFSFTSKVAIYPDLTSSWTISHLDSDQLDENDEMVNTKINSTRLDLVAQLYSKLSANLLVSYANTQTEVDSRNSGNSTLGLRYRPSESLSLRGSYTTFMGDTTTDDRYGLSMYLVLIRNAKTNLSMTANHARSTSTSNSMSFNGTWKISQYFSLLTRGNYRIAERDSYSFTVTLSMRL